MKEAPMPKVFKNKAHPRATWYGIKKLVLCSSI